MASSNPGDRNPASSINELERAQQALRRTPEQPGRADPGAGQSGPSPTTPTFAPRVPSGMDSLNAYIQTTDRQRGILAEDSQFIAFQQANPWAHTVSDSAIIAALENDFDIGRERRLRLRNEVMQALARAGNTEPVQVLPHRLDPTAAEFRPRQPSLTQGGHLRLSRPGSPSSGHVRQSSQPGSPLGAPGRQVSGGSPVGGPGRQVSGGSPAGGHGRYPSQGSQGGQGGQ